MRLAIVNGPNLNLLGQREPGIYGTTGFDTFLQTLRDRFPGIHLSAYQSNVEGELINHLHTLRHQTDGIVINPGGYSHTSVAIADALKAMTCPCIEVHISQVHAREDFRQTLITARSCQGVISGFGLEGYAMAIKYLVDYPTQPAAHS